MFLNRAIHTSVCASCRIRASIAAKQLARSRLTSSKAPSRFFSTSRKLGDDTKSPATVPETQSNNATPAADFIGKQRPEDIALRARQTFGDALPEGHLNEQEYRVYERLYGKPLKYEERMEILQEELVEDEGLDAGTGVLREVEGGALEEVEFDEEDGGVDLQEEHLDVSDADVRLAQDIRASLSNSEAEHPTSQERSFFEEEEAEQEEPYQRTHPLTLATRFTTTPSTLLLPTSSLTNPISSLLAGTSNTHLSQSAHRIFGGLGLPHSTSTPTFGKRLQQKAIPLSASQSHMSEIEGDVFLAALWPGVYASVMAVLVETRKRLGTAWAEELVRKAGRGELRILEAGGGGAGVLALRECLKAEWERMCESDPVAGSTVALAESDGRIGGVGASPPLGHATVLTASDVLRKRASKVLENTTFVPRLPDYVHTTEVKKEGKFDIVIAPHTLWELGEDYLRKTHVENLWALLKQDGGVLILLEKGVARGFEVLAGARQTLLEQYISSPPSVSQHEYPNEKRKEKEKGMIIAPCTNHSACPMYAPQGMLKGRRDICHFSQRYVRPAFLQTILGAKDKNFEDVKFAYLSVMRGRDLREEAAVKQGEEATLRAFEGFENVDTGVDVMDGRRGGFGLELPRAILPPLKRKGHVTLDLCTPSGTLERWTVPRSFSKQAFRDARKSSWGDLWALGAKTRVRRMPRGRKRRGDEDGNGSPAADLDVKVVRKRVGSKGKGKRRKEGGMKNAVSAA